jgi:hypothetical protein
MVEPGTPLVHLTPDRIALEIRRGEAAEATARAWRRHLGALLVCCFGSQLVATAIGMAGFTVADHELGWLLVNVGQVGVVAFPFLIGVVWVAEMSRRGQL